MSHLSKLAAIDAAYSRLKACTLHLATINDFVNAVHCRLPFSVTFPTLNVVHISFTHCNQTKTLYLTVREFEDIIGYSLMHIDDIL